MPASSRPLVVFTDDTIHPAAAERLASSCELHILSGAYPSEDELVEAVADADAVFARLAVMTRRVIDSGKKLKIIARHGIGVDAVDLQAATERGILVTTTGTANSNAVAEYTIAMILGLLREIVAADAGMRDGQWTRGPLVGEELEEMTLGVVGIGSIGSLVALKGVGLGMKVLAQDPRVNGPPDSRIEMTTREDLLKRADIVTLHTRLEEGTWHTINSESFELMKKDSIFVNNARGECVDEKALIEVLKSQRIAGAALDVFEVEPLPADSPLRQLPNVLLSPHVAGQTHAAMRRVAIAAATAIEDALAGRIPRYVYNPEALEIRQRTSSRHR